MAAGASTPAPPRDRLAAFIRKGIRMSDQPKLLIEIVSDVV
jgi:hypothetical protein